MQTNKSLKGITLNFFDYQANRRFTFTLVTMQGRGYSAILQHTKLN